MSAAVPEGGLEKRPHRSENFNGMKFFNGMPINQVPDLAARVAAITPDQLREKMKVWRPEETIAAAVPFFGEGKVMIKGPPQSGKGTIIYGLTEMCDILNVGYLFIDGHHLETSGDEVADQIDKASVLGYPVFFDSYDYLFLGSRKMGRGMSEAAQKTRDDKIIGALQKAEVPIALTFHDEEHTRRFMSGDRIAEYQAFHDQFPVYNLPLFLQSEASTRRFLADHEAPAPVIDYMMELGQNGDFLEAADSADEVQMESRQILDSIRTYPVLKMLIRPLDPRKPEESLREPFLTVMDRVLKGPLEPDYHQSLTSLAVLLELAETRRLGLTNERLAKKYRKK